MVDASSRPALLCLMLCNPQSTLNCAGSRPECAHSKRLCSRQTLSKICTDWLTYLPSPVWGKWGGKHQSVAVTTVVTEKVLFLPIELIMTDQW